MKALSILLIAVVVASSSVFAKNNTPSKIEYCNVVAKYAKLTMSGRQNGEQASDVLVRIEQNVSDQFSKRLFMSIVRDAYTQPVWHSDMQKIEAETEFSNQALLACLGMFDD